MKSIVARSRVRTSSTASGRPSSTCRGTMTTPLASPCRMSPVLTSWPSSVTGCADVDDLEIGVGDDDIAGEVGESEPAHLMHVTQTAVGHHPDRAEPHGQRRHHLAGQRAS